MRRDGPDRRESSTVPRSFCGRRRSWRRPSPSSPPPWPPPASGAGASDGAVLPALLLAPPPIEPLTYLPFAASSRALTIGTVLVPEGLPPFTAASNVRSTSRPWKTTSMIFESGTRMPLRTWSKSTLHAVHDAFYALKAEHAGGAFERVGGAKDGFNGFFVAGILLEL